MQNGEPGIIFTIMGMCLFAPFGLVGAGLLVWYFRARKKAELSLRWPHTKGKVVASFVRQSTHIDSDDMSTEVTYYPAVRYTYTVDGKEYESGQIAFGGVAGGSRPASAQRVVNRYPEGAEVVVYYNPEKPSEAVLEHGGPPPFLLIIGGIFLSMGLCGFIPVFLGIVRAILAPVLK